MSQNETDQEIENLPEKLAREYLPQPLQDSTIVLPKRLHYWASFNIFVLGIGIGLFVSWGLGDMIPLAWKKWLPLGFVTIYIVLRLIYKFILEPEEEKFFKKSKSPGANESGVN